MGGPGVELRKKVAGTGQMSKADGQCLAAP